MITFPDKKEGDKIYPDELNAIKLGVNEQLSRLDLVDGKAYTAFGSVASRIEAIEQYLLTLTQQNKILSTILATALPDYFKRTVSESEYSQKVNEATQLRAEVQSLVDNGSTDPSLIAQKRRELAYLEAGIDRTISEKNVETEHDIKSDAKGNYIANQIYIRWRIQPTSEDGLEGIEDIDQELLDKYQLTKVVQDTGERGVVSMGLYQLPKGTDARDVIRAIAQESNGSLVVMTAGDKAEIDKTRDTQAALIEALSLNRNTKKETAPAYVKDEIIITWRDGVDNAQKTEIATKWRLALKDSLRLTNSDRFTILPDTSNPSIPWINAKTLEYKIVEEDWESVKYASVNSIGSLA
jgi:hypothetical protein